MRDCIVVIGMHRSGTSAMMGALQLLGVYPGSNLLGPAEDNPKGFFENLDILAVNEKILIAAGSSWDDLFALPEQWWNRVEMTKYREEIVKIIQRDLHDTPLPGFKDPRISRLLPLWESIFREVSMRPHYVILLRNPLEVARSLEKRNNFTIEKSLLLWMNYMLDAEFYTRGFPRVFVCFEQLLLQPEEAINRVSDRLHVTFPKQYHEVSGDIQQFLTPQLRHHALPDRELKSVLPIIHDLYHVLTQISNGAEISAKILSEIDAIREEYGKTKNFFCKCAASLLPHAMHEESSKKTLVSLGKASVIIVTHNNLDLTKACIESILAKTDYPDYEIVIVDNASSDGTPDYLKDLAQRWEFVTVILNQENVGFAVALNKGISIASGTYVVLMNNDIVVTRGWLEKFVNYLSRYPDIGLIGPVTNACFNEARIPVSYQDISDLDSFAEGYVSSHKGMFFDVPMLEFFCVAMRRTTVEEIGLLDERFGMGLFEDDDYSLRVRLQGYRVVCAEDIFIHHWGMASFKKLQETGEYAKIFEMNRKIYEEKWGITWRPRDLRPDYITISSLRAEIQEKSHTIDAMTAELARKRHLVETLQAEIEARSREIEQKRIVIEQVSAERDRIRQELLKIRSSYSWRAITKMLTLLDSTPMAGSLLKRMKRKLDARSG